MASVFIPLVLGALAFAGLFLLAEIGVRNGDRPDDSRVSAELWTSGQTDEPRPVLVAEIRNPSSAPLLAGMSARRTRLPDWLVVSSATVPFLTSRRGLRADAYDVVGIVPAGEIARFTVPVDHAGRRYWLVAAVGQRGGRLRVHRVPVDAATRPRSPATRAMT